MKAVESLFQTNPNHPFTQSIHPCKHKGPAPLTKTPLVSTEECTADRKILHFCPHSSFAGKDLDKFCLNRKEVNDIDFLDKEKIFSYRTIDSSETLRKPITTFR